MGSGQPTLSDSKTDELMLQDFLLPKYYRFHPKDHELLEHYLLPKLQNLPFHLGLIADFDIYQSSPSNLVGRAFNNGLNNVMFFFTSRKKKGKRVDRTTGGGGFWRMSTKIMDISAKSCRGKKNTLVYYKGKNQKTNWIMHEYILENAYGYQVDGNNMVVCKIFLRKPEDEGEEME